MDVIDKILTSKINWAQYIGFVAMLVALVTHLDMTLADQAELAAQLVAIQSSVHGVTVILRTWFNKPK